MKKLFLFLSVAFLVMKAQSQISLPKIDPKAAASALSSFVKPPAIGDIGKTTGSIVTELATKLALPATQKPALTEAIGGFLKDKSSILSLAGTNPTQYLAKFNPLQSGLFSKIKGIVGAAKFADFLKLKPSSATGALSNLFF
ncbi:MAG: hypothetical protein J0I09_06750 [Sphingobacteriia bacterium]|nr:hypothetical protein [Sphingobacteriia bacterium]